MSDDPAGACAVACGTVCLELIGGLCLDFASITHPCTSRLCPWPSDSNANDESEEADQGERDLLIPKSHQPPSSPAMSQSPSGP